MRKLLILAVLCLNACTEKVDINEIDSLMAHGNYREAVKILRKSNSTSGLNQVEKQRIRVRLMKAERILYFENLDKYIYERNWDKAAAEADNLKTEIDKMDKKIAAPYYFDYYYKRSQVDSVLIGIDQWKRNLDLALNHYTPDYRYEQEIYLKQAFYYSLTGEFVKAREMMDKAMRKMSITEIDSTLKQSFLLYMEGKFKDSRERLSSVEIKYKNEIWQKFELFLALYGDSLTMQERFKLW
jgi:hypothetical protein